MSLSPGDRLGRYVIVGAVGAGGMGEVYRARDERLSRDVAIKVLLASSTDDPDRIQRFEQEAQAAGRLNHPNIVAIHDVGTHNGVPYLVTELLDGHTLRHAIAAGPLPLDRVLDYATQIGRGLAAAHDKGIVHRDLKPDNLFVTGDGTIKILDFGLAKLMQPPDRAPGDAADLTTMAALTTVGTVLGTAAYMSPEQVRGESADGRSDLFAFGAILHEMTTGQRAFHGRSIADTMSAVLRDEPAAAAPDAMPPMLARVARRCLQKRPDDRFQSARDLVFALSEVSTNAGAARIAAPSRSGVRRIGWMGLTAAGAVAMAALAQTFGLVDLRRFVPKAGPGVPIHTVAVKPFENLAHDPDQAFFSDGVTSALTASLTRIADLRVISCPSADTPPAQLAKDWNVDGVIEGAVGRSGDQVQISVTLRDARTGRRRWWQDFHRDIRDVMTLEHEVAGAIARETGITVTADEASRLAAVRPVNAAAQEAYLLGRYWLDKGTEPSILKAIQYFNQSKDADPAYALPWAGIADANTALRSVYRRPLDVMPFAREAAAKALQCDPLLAEAHVSMAGVLMYFDFDWTAAEKELRTAIDLAPGLALAHDYYALLLASVGRHDEAEAHANRARDLAPFSLMIMNDAGWVAYLAKKFDRTQTLNAQAIQMDDKFWPAYRDLGLAYEKAGRFPEAIARMKKALDLDPSHSPSILEMLAGSYAAAGRRDEARKVLAELTEQSGRHYVCPYEVATVHACLGDTKAALEALNEGYDQRADCMPWASWDEKLDSLRGNPEFQALMKKMGLEGKTAPVPKVK